MNVSQWCTRVIRWTFYLLVILVPLILTSINFELFEYNKMMVTYALTVIIAGTWTVKMIVDREIRISRTPLDIPIGLFVLSQFVSTIFSMDPHVSWMGYYSRFNGGMWSVISYVILYYAFVTNFLELTPSANSKQQKNQPPTLSFPIPNSLLTFLKVALGTAIVVALYGVAEHFGIDKQMWVQDVQNRVFSSLGQPNWLAAYLATLLPITMVFALKHTPTFENGSLKSQPLRLLQYVLWFGTSILFFIVLLFTRSRSGLVGFVVADALLWILLAIRASNRKYILPTFLLMHILFAAIIFINGSNISQLDRYISLNGIRSSFAEKRVSKEEPKKPAGYVAPLLETGGTESGTIRKYVWEAAVRAWRSTTKTFLIGTGTESFAFAFYRFRPSGHNMTSEWDFLYNKAHNEYLNYLATTGVFGLGSYLLFIGAFVWWFVKTVLGSWFMVHGKDNMGISANNELIQLNSALFAGWLSIIITNFFGFSVVIVQLFLFLFPAAMLVLNTRDKEKFSRLKLPANTPLTALTVAFVAVSAILLGILITLWYADTLYASSYRLARSGQYPAADILVERAVALHPGEPVYHDELSSTLIAIAAGALEQQNATVGGQLAERAIAENNRALAISPQNVNFWKTKTKILYSLSAFDPKFNADAVNALEQAKKLSPNDPKIVYNLAILYGRQGENDKAIQLLESAVVLKPDYRDAYYALYVFFGELKRPADARAILNKYLQNINPLDAQFSDLVAKLK